jgi:hypothetical protein
MIEILLFAIVGIPCAVVLGMALYSADSEN